MSDTHARRAKLQALLEQDPADPFLRYALALEMEKTAEHAESLRLLEGLTAEQPPYVPAFFMGAQQLTRLERVTEARTWLRAGIEAARAAGDSHAAAEMAEFLTSLGSRGE